MWGATLQEGAGPGDAQLAASRDHARELNAVGICAPSNPTMSPVDQLLQVVLWHVDLDGNVTEITQPEIVDAELFDLGEAYYGPPPEVGDSWPPGRYVFEIRRLAGGASRWMALDFIPTNAT
jgi:hypothetical protein